MNALAIKELMERYNELKARWEIVNGGTEEQFHEWFTNQVKNAR